jgi:hypothetical protein
VHIGLAKIARSNNDLKSKDARLDECSSGNSRYAKDKSPKGVQISCQGPEKRLDWKVC